MTRWQQLLNMNRPLLADGGMGTRIQQRAKAAGFPSTSPPELLLNKAPELIASIHEEYARAGSDILLTNTFACSRLQLKKRHNEDLFEDVHQTAVRIARAAAGPDLAVFGDLGPLGEFFPPMGALTVEACTAAYAERARLLHDTEQIDGIVIETQFDLQEVACAIDGVRSVSDLPLVVTLSFERHGRTMMGVTPEAFGELMREKNVYACGANCGASIPKTLDAIGSLRTVVPHAFLWAKPNAGLPQLIEGIEIYDVDPPAFAATALRFFESGVRVFGGCCGTTPEYIDAVRRVLSDVSAT